MIDASNPSGADDSIEAMVPRGDGHQFVFYGDACSGVAGAPHEKTFAATNSAVTRLDPAPEFIVFAGDEIAGLTADEAELRKQWRHWFEAEMAWLDRAKIPLYNTTSNHTTYDQMSERVFADVMAHLPRNGPSDQQGLSYHVRRDDLQLAFIHTGWSGLGGEGHVERSWLAETLEQHADARYSFVVGHHPVFPVNGFSGEYQREICHVEGAELWELLVRHRVTAYVCSHILAFDVQVHSGVLQIVTAGAGTAHRMPEETEYLHFVQGAIDGEGLRYQVIDQSGAVREHLQWPLALPPSGEWPPFPGRDPIDPLAGTQSGLAGFSKRSAMALRVSGTAAADREGQPQTLLAAAEDSALPSLWIGLTGRSQRLTAALAPTAGRSPHYWFGDAVVPGRPFDFQLLLHPGMGPGGLLWRADDRSPWSSLRSASPWGLERLAQLEQVGGPARWTVGHTGVRPTAEFRGSHLRAFVCRQQLE